MTPYENISLILSFEVPEDFISKIQETTFTKINIKHLETNQKFKIIKCTAQNFSWN